jgi:hypothetical protein
MPPVSAAVCGVCCRYVKQQCPDQCCSAAQQEGTTATHLYVSLLLMRSKDP